MSAVRGTPKPAALAIPKPSLQITTVDDLSRVAEILYRGGCTPPGIDRPEKVAAIIMAGLEVGLTPTQALGSIMLTNGRLSIYGDGALALVLASGLLESIAEDVAGVGDERKGTCKIKRKGEEARTFTFTIGEAKQAKLIERAKGSGPWATYPDRMLLMRARGFALRDVFPDVLRGLLTVEEVTDYSEQAGPRVVQIERPCEMQAVAGVPMEHSKPVAELPAAPMPTGQSCPAPASAPAPAAAPAPSPAPAPAPTSPPSAEVGSGPATADQFKLIRNIKDGLLLTLNEPSPTARESKWVELLATYGVRSAKEFSRDQAAKFIDIEGPKYDPFGQPASPALRT